MVRVDFDVWFCKVGLNKVDVLTGLDVSVVFGGIVLVVIVVSCTDVIAV